VFFRFHHLHFVEEDYRILNLATKVNNIIYTSFDRRSANTLYWYTNFFVTIISNYSSFLSKEMETKEYHLQYIKLFIF